MYWPIFLAFGLTRNTPENKTTSRIQIPSNEKFEKTFT